MESQNYQSATIWDSTVYILLKLISRKNKWQKNSEIFTLWRYTILRTSVFLLRIASQAHFPLSKCRLYIFKKRTVTHDPQKSREYPPLDSLFFSQRRLKSHSVEISWFFYHLDFTWNQFWGFYKCKMCHFSTIRGSEIWVSWIFAPFEGWNIPN